MAAFVLSISLFVHVAPPLRVIIAKPGTDFVAGTVHVPAVIGAPAVAALAAPAVAVLVTFAHVFSLRWVA
jgi:hypothetical protein